MHPRQFGKFHRVSISAAILFHSSGLSGNLKYIGCRIRHIAAHVSFTMFDAIDLPIKKLKERLLKVSPFARNLTVMARIGWRNLVSFFSIVGPTSFTNVSNVLGVIRRKLKSEKQ